MFATWPPEPAGFYDVAIDRVNTPTRVLHKFKTNVHKKAEHKRYTPKVRKHSDCQME
jgi:hypothetical protein